MKHIRWISSVLVLLLALAMALPAWAAESGYPETLLSLGLEQPQNTKLQAVSTPPGTVVVCYLTSEEDMEDLVASVEGVLTAAGWTISQSFEDYRGWFITASGQLHRVTILLNDDDPIVIEMSLQKAL